jgi:hypothetical protein
MIYGTPTIVTNGLVLNLDAASPKAAPTRNLLYNTNDLTNTGAWLKYRSTLTASAAIAPDGTNTAYAWNIDPTGTSALVRLAAISNNGPISSSIYGGPYTFSVYVKNRNCTATDFNLSLYNGPFNIGNEPVYNIVSGFTPTGIDFPSATFSNIIRRSEDAGNGWYRISYTTTVTGSLNTFNVFFDIEAGGGTKVAGEGIYIWGPQFEVGSVPSPYQPTTNTTPPWPSIGSTVTASMVNRPTWVSSNGGSVVFDGVNDYIQLSTSQSLSNNYTIHVIFKSQTTGSSSDYFRLLNGLTSVAQSSMRLEWANRFLAYNNSASLQSYAFNYPLVPSFNLSQLYNDMHITVDNSNVLTVYNNGVACTPTSIITGSIDFQVLGRAQSGFIPETISVFQLYNRALSQAEVLQNYNALKSRFGLS